MFQTADQQVRAALDALDVAIRSLEASEQNLRAAATMKAECAVVRKLRLGVTLTWHAVQEARLDLSKRPDLCIFDPN